MWIPVLLSFAIATVRAEYVVESASFGHGSSISPNNVAIPGWHIVGEGHVPQLMSDRVVLTPPYPGNRRGAIWADNKIQQAEWTADFEFRATGPERGGGNLQIWYTREGQKHVGTSSIYTVGKFDGLVLVVDTYGGRGGGIRGFLNDGNTEFKNHHNVDSLAFGHCDYSYRNLGRPSRIQIKQLQTTFEVSVDGRSCFKSDKIKLPPDYYFGISAASADTPDSFEIYKFILSTSSSYAREEPRRDIPNAPQHQQQPPPPQQHQQADMNPPASSSKSTEAQLTDLHNRLQTMSQSLDNLFRHLATLSGNSESRHQELTRRLTSAEQMSALDGRLQAIERTVQAIQRDVEGKDYHGQLAKLQDTLRDSHSSIIESLPHTLNHIVSTSRPRMGFFLFIVIVFQLLLAASYIVYKRRRANAPKKYL